MRQSIKHPHFWSNLGRKNATTLPRRLAPTAAIEVGHLIGAAGAGDIRIETDGAAKLALLLDPDLAGVPQGYRATCDHPFPNFRSSGQGEPLEPGPCTADQFSGPHSCDFTVLRLSGSLVLVRDTQSVGDERSTSGRLQR